MLYHWALLTNRNVVADNILDRKTLVEPTYTVIRSSRKYRLIVCSEDHIVGHDLGGL